MDRRSLIRATAVAALVPTLLGARFALAEDAAAKAPALSDAEAKHLDKTAALGLLSLATARTAVEMATDAEVKAFAQAEAAEQEILADAVRSLRSEAPGSASVQAPSEAEAEAQLSDEGKLTLSKLKDMDGAGFDKAFVELQIDTHNQLLEAQEAYLASGSTRAAQLMAAKMARGTVREHLDRLQALRRKLG